MPPAQRLNRLLSKPAHSPAITNHAARRLAMKISDSSPIRSIALRRLRGGNGASSSEFANHLPEEQPAAATPLGGTGALGGVDALLSLQEVEDAATGRSKGLRRADDLLDRLEEIQLGLLTGALSRENLQELARAVRQRRAEPGDARLNDILDQIELRAAVELAKYGPRG